ncbi:MAG: Na/Pi cotransporter family protein [Spirochaetes bacterium]|nr:Na/Pi cotransporter family protein [Spirochaetota bacterium]
MVLHIVFICFKLAGALAMFMYGMDIASEGIQRAAGARLQKTVNFMTRNSVFAILTGIIVTILLQSSSAATVMVVSFVNAGLLTLVQAIGVIMGSNIGTTLTGWIIAAAGIGKYSIILLAVPFFGVGFFMTLMKKRSVAFRSYGQMLMGFAFIFLGLDFLSTTIPDPNAGTLMFLKDFAGMGWITVVLCVLVGSVFTMLIHASSATMAIVIGLAAKDFIDFRMAAALVVGANIGTTIDSFLVSVGGNTAAKRAAWSHILFNVLGSIWVVLLFEPFLLFVDWIVPGAVTPATVGVHIAMTHTVFNAANTSLLFPFIKPYAKLVSWIIRGKPEKEKPFSLAYAVRTLSANPDINLVYARKEMSAMANLSSTMFGRFVGLLSAPPKDWTAELEEFKAMEGYADQMRDELSSFLFECQRQNPSAGGQEQIGAMMRMTVELESVTDDCFRLAILLERGKTRVQKLDRKSIDELASYTALVTEALAFARDHVNEPITADGLALASGFEDRIDEFKSQLKKAARKRLQAGAEVKTELLFLDIIRHIEKIGDHAYAVSNALRDMAA